MIVSIFVEELREVIKKSLLNYIKNLDGEAPASCFYQDMMSSFEKPLIEEVLIQVGYNQTKASEFLGIHRNTLGKRLKELGISIKKG